jgi:uncharacterized protein YndB with AHSA1/START domain
MAHKDQFTIEKQIEIEAPVAKVWDAISDYKQFGEWFRVALKAPFETGKVAEGNILHPGYEHVVWRATVKDIVPEKLFSFTWHPYGIDPKVDYTKETPTLVEFKLEKTAKGTLLTITESGFDKVPAHRRTEAFRMNDQGWSAQIKNIEKFVAR